MPDAPSPVWVVMPVLANREMTRTAIADVLAQTVPVRLLVVNQGVDDAFREELEETAEAEGDQVIVWHHQPPLPSLAATWNRALRAVWEAGGEEALVVNNDVRLHRQTVETLQIVRDREAALFVSAVGVTPDQFDPQAVHALGDPTDPAYRGIPKGGPDFSCFLISRACHERFAFDEHFIPAFCVTPDTPVLRADLRWVPIGTLGIGDRLLTVDEDDSRVKPGAYRRRCYKVGWVKETRRRLAPCIKITLVDGRSVICSSDHRWLVKHPVPGNIPYRWRAASELAVGWRIATPLDPWSAPSTYEEGWLGGILDGEGMVRQRGSSGLEVHIAQKEGFVLDQIRQLLDQFGIHYTWRVRPENGVAVVEIAVRRHAFHALGRFRPLRLLQKLQWTDTAVFSRKAPMDYAISTIEPVGEQEVVTIETSSKTYLANGMIAHNCEDLDYHRRLLLAGEGARIFSVNLPYLHYGSATLKTLEAPQRAAIQRTIETGSRAYYARKWGGPVNAERFLVPFDPVTAARDDGTATTPYLQAHPPAGEAADGQEA